jgi:HNH endonuclease
VPRGRPDIANTAVRIFLHEMGIAYDEERGREPYKKTKHFQTIQTFFSGRCCYCGIDFSTEPAVEDHLVPTNKTDLGLHAWGNIVPACRECNAKKQGADWRDFIIQRADTSAPERHARMREFLAEYQYDPPGDLRDVAGELYDEVGEIAMALIKTKIKRTRDKL